MRQGLQSVLLCLLMVFGSLSGCFGPDEEEEDVASTHWLPNVEAVSYTHLRAHET